METVEEEDVEVGKAFSLVSSVFCYGYNLIDLLTDPVATLDTLNSGSRFRGCMCYFQYIEAEFTE